MKTDQSEQKTIEQIREQLQKERNKIKADTVAFAAKLKAVKKIK
ncbi:hypothetical protein [Hahella ganghwensis]|nr:hypothetical protein [Hahella ganghwensis]